MADSIVGRNAQPPFWLPPMRCRGNADQEIVEQVKAERLAGQFASRAKKDRRIAAWCPVTPRPELSTYAIFPLPDKNGQTLNFHLKFIGALRDTKYLAARRQGADMETHTEI